jgi:putative protein-disulfide isomerase
MSPQPGGPGLSAFVRPHADRIAQLTGQPFGKTYLDGLTANPQAIFDSQPPATALLAAAEFGRGIEFLLHLQHAHFAEGANISDRVELFRLATTFGFDQQSFADAFHRLRDEPTGRHIQEARTLLAKVGGAGFPTYAYESEQGWSMLNSAPCLGKPEQWAQALASLP